MSKLRLLSVALLTFSLTAFAGSTADAKHDIVDVANSAGSFQTLLVAVKAAGLEDTLRSEGPFTVFAPTDEAFAAIPKETLNALLADKEALKKVLLYHVVSGEVNAKTVVGLDKAQTAAGLHVPIHVKGGKVKVGDATVVKTDINASNGLIHVVNSVILPPE